MQDERDIPSDQLDFASSVGISQGLCQKLPLSRPNRRHVARAFQHAICTQRALLAGIGMPFALPVLARRSSQFKLKLSMP